MGGVEARRMNITEKQFVDLVGLFDNHLGTISIILSIVGVVGGLILYSWVSHMKQVVAIELDKYIKSDEFEKMVDSRVKDRLRVLEKKSSSVSDMEKGKEGALGGTFDGTLDKDKTDKI